MRLFLSGEFIDANDVKDIIRSIANLISLGETEGGFRPDTPNWIKWELVE